MDPFAFPPLAALLNAAYGALVGLSTLLEPLAGASAAALAVVLVTLLVRALLIPVGISQAKAEQTRSRLAPKLRELQRRHKKNPERLQKETLALYREENTSPFAGDAPGARAGSGHRHPLHAVHPDRYRGARQRPARPRSVRRSARHEPRVGDLRRHRDRLDVARLRRSAPGDDRGRGGHPPRLPPDARRRRRFADELAA